MVKLTFAINNYFDHLLGVSSIIFKKLLDFLIYKPSKDKEVFVLEETPQEGKKLKQEKEQPGRSESTSEGRPGNQRNAREAGDRQKEDFQDKRKAGVKKIRVPRLLGQRKVTQVKEQRPGKKNKSQDSQGHSREKGQGAKQEDSKQGWGDLSHRLESNREKIKAIYTIPKNKDFAIRDFAIGLEQPVKAFALFMEGLTDKNVINMTVLQPLMLLSRLDGFEQRDSLVDLIKEQLLPGNQVNKSQSFKEIVEAVNFGATAVFIEGCKQALVVETKGWEHRNVSTPRGEQVIRGPHEAFTEVLRVNTALIRKQLRSHELITEMYKIGASNKNDVAIMYVSTVANQELVKEVIRRVTSIKMDYIADSGVLEQLIEDHPYSIVPQIIATERPDRVSFFLSQGRVAILLDGSPYGLVVPGSLFEQLHTPEDYYLRPAHGTVLRLVRTLSFYIAFLLPGIYLSIVLFHQEMIPTDLLLAISSARDRVPFPSIVEVIIMELSFELIREAGIRIPGVLGNTIGIVGALILGQAAVQANIVSPILIIITAVTALASFAVPSYSLQFALRIARFAYIFLGAFLGFFGMTLGLFFHISLMAAQKTFGVPYIAPLAPQTGGGKGILIRSFIWNKEKRPDYLQVPDQKLQPEVSRGWVKEGEKDTER